MTARPSTSDLARANEALGLRLDPAELAALQPLVAGFAASLAQMGVVSEVRPPTSHRRAPGAPPDPQENALGAWQWRCSVTGSASGPLAAQRVVLKDNIALAGMPMVNGSDALSGYVPEFDATVATRILDAGGEIVGKAVCESLCLSAGSHTAVSGPVRNPHDPTRTTGGSSSGCAALLAAGHCDLAIGGDQGGSIRIPSAFCGVYGLKPTFGLVPYTGAFPLDMTIDHLGPMGRSVENVATLLDVIAGPDGLDPRQAGIQPHPYREALNAESSPVAVGLLEEGFGHPGADPEVEEAVRQAAERLVGPSSRLVTLSVPVHRSAGGFSGAILSQGMVSTVLRGSGTGTGWKGWYPTSMVDAFGRGWRASPHTLPDTAKVMALLGQYLDTTYGPRYYARAQNLVPGLTAAYDQALREVDVLVLPTAPTTAPLLPPEDAGMIETLMAAFSGTANTAQFDVTGHPAMSVPCGWVAGLPVGMMLVGRRGEDDVVLRAARALEDTGVFSPRPGVH